MRRFVIGEYSLSRNTILGFFLIGIWFAGLSLGFIAVRFHGDTLVSCLSQAVGSPASIATPFMALFPLLISALAVILLHPGLLYIICFVRGTVLTMMLQALVCVFDDGACLAAVFLLFSSLSFSPVLLWYWWRRLCLRMVCFKPDTVVCVMAGLIIGGIDYWFISPFLVDIINF